MSAAGLGAAVGGAAVDALAAAAPPGALAAAAPLGAGRAAGAQAASAAAPPRPSSPRNPRRVRGSRFASGRDWRISSTPCPRGPARPNDRGRASGCHPAGGAKPPSPGTADEYRTGDEPPLGSARQICCVLAVANTQQSTSDALAPGRQRLAVPHFELGGVGPPVDPSIAV